MDCQAAKRFFSENKVDFEDKNVEELKNREEVVRNYGRMLTPTIVIDEEVFLGFGNNKENIKIKLKI